MGAKYNDIDGWKDNETPLFCTLTQQKEKRSTFLTYRREKAAPQKGLRQSSSQKFLSPRKLMNGSQTHKADWGMAGWPTHRQNKGLKLFPE